MCDKFEDLVEALNILWSNFNNCRAYFPAVKSEDKGEKQLRTAPIYIKQGFDVSFVFNDGISEKEINKINEIGHWINQNFIIRLCALLESHHILSNDNKIKIDFNLKGAEHIDLVRRLRNYFAHSSGKFHPEKDEHVTTVRVLKKVLSISDFNTNEFPLPIDTVLEPLFKGCKLYAKKKSNKGINSNDNS